MPYLANKRDAVLFGYANSQSFFLTLLIVLICAFLIIQQNIFFSQVYRTFLPDFLSGAIGNSCKGINPFEIAVSQIVDLINQHLLEDGRYIALAISFYAGVRPAECRALKWEDVKPITGHPGCYYFEIHHTLDRMTKDQESTKTENAYRPVPIHIELQTLLDRWKNHIENTTGQKPEGYICCAETAYGTPCSHYQYANFAKSKVYSRLDADMLFQNALSMAIEEYEGEQGHNKYFDPDENLTLYVLRRNFWTWLQSSTRLTPLEKKYVMGHEMIVNRENLRSRFNNQDLLWKIGQEMNRFSVMTELHDDYALLIREVGKNYSVSSTGYTKIRIPSRLLTEGGKLEIDTDVLESGDTLVLKLLSPIRGNYQVEGQAELLFKERSFLASPALITEYGNRAALENVKRRNRRKV